MSAIAPPQYEIVVENEDSFGRPNEIRGQCNFEQSYPYVASVCLVNFGALLFTIVEAVKARNLSMEFAESAQIFRALITITMVLFVGGPVLLLSRDNANTFLFVVSAIIFVASTSILLLLFVPKIRFWMDSKKKTDTRRIHISGIDASERMNTSQYSLPTDSFIEFDVDAENSAEFTGMKILTTKTPEELLKEVEVLKRLLRQAKAPKEGNSDGEFDASNRSEGKASSAWKAMLKKSKQLFPTRIDEEIRHGDLENSVGTTGVLASECSEQDSPSESIRDDDSIAMEVKEMLG